eukprot:Hpha_TRINITY_DN17918_c0_g1::TRINITY_DN17918_c0_g1_i1::g.33701::m.33701
MERSPCASSLLLGCFVASTLARSWLLRPDAGLLSRWVLLPWCCGHLHGLLSAAALLYCSRTLERFWGTRRYVGFCATTAAVSAALNLLLGTLLRVKAAPLRYRPGPLPLLAALGLRCITDVPALTSGIGSEKAMIGALLFATSYDPDQGAGDVLTWAVPQVVLGIVASLLVSSQRTPLCRVQAPALLSTWASTWLAPFVSSAPAAEVPAAAMAMADQAGGEFYSEQLLPTTGDIVRGDWQPDRRQHTPGLRHRHTAGAGAPAPSEEHVNALVHLGFEREQAVAALRSNNNDPDAAASALLNAL